VLLACRTTEVSTPPPSTCPQSVAHAPVTITLPASGQHDDAISPQAESFLPRSFESLLSSLRRLEDKFQLDMWERSRTAFEIAITYDELEARAHLNYLSTCEMHGTGQPCDERLRALRAAAHENAEKWCRYLQDRYPGEHACRAPRPRSAGIELDGSPASPPPAPRSVPGSLPVPPCVAVMPTRCPDAQVVAVGGCATPGEVAHLDLNAIPSSEIYVNGCWVGTTPRRGLTVQAGRIEVTFESDRGRTVRTVDVKPGETKTVVARAH
jgi:hypothetical protein